MLGHAHILKVNKSDLYLYKTFVSLQQIFIFIYLQIYLYIYFFQYDEKKLIVWYQHILQVFRLKNHLLVNALQTPANPKKFVFGYNHQLPLYFIHSVLSAVAKPPGFSVGLEKVALSL